MGGVAGVVVPFRGWKNTSQVMRTNVVKLKQQDPNCRWRLEQTVAPFNDIVQTLQQQEQGLEKPESHWVELSEYLKEFPAPEENAIVYEWVNGSRIAGVNVLTGRKGWHKRVDRSTSTVRRVTDLSDKTCDLDPTGAALDRIAKAATKQILPKQSYTQSVPLFHGSGSSSSKGPDRCQPMETENPNDEAGTEAADDDGSDDDDMNEAVGIFRLLKSRFDTNPKRAEPKAKTAAVKAASARAPKAAAKAKAKASTRNTKAIGKANRKRKADKVEARCC